MSRPLSEDTLRSLSRLYHMLDVDGADLTKKDGASDPAILVAMYMGGIHRTIFQHPLLNPRFSWTRKMLEALKLMIGWQKGNVQHQQLLDDKPVWSKYLAALDGLANALRGGFSKKVSASKKQRALERRASDSGKLYDFPAVAEMKHAVSLAMMCLTRIKATYGGLQALPRGVQAEATAALVGIIFLNGFGGRKLEWERMTLDHIQSQFNQGLDFLVCDEHKTAKVYGSLAKWLAPGTQEAIKVYVSLPRDPAATKLFAPCFSDNVSVPSYFRKFCEGFVVCSRLGGWQRGFPGGLYRFGAG